MCKLFKNIRKTLAYKFGGIFSLSILALAFILFMLLGALLMAGVTYLRALKDQRTLVTAEADALAYYNAKVAQNYQVEIKLKELEIELEKAKKWDGRQVPEYVPLTAAGGIVNLPAGKN